jgi:predicted PurR-regulated permease PerM
MPDKTRPKDTTARIKVVNPETQTEAVKSDLMEWTEAIFRTDRMVKILLVMAIILLGTMVAFLLWTVAGYISGQLLMFFSAWLVALILTPFIRSLMQLGLPKVLAIIGAVVGFMAIIGLVLTILLPGLISQTQELISNLGSIFNNVITSLNATMSNLGLGQFSLDQLATQVQAFGQDLLRGSLGLLTGATGFLLQILLTFIIVVIILFTRDYNFRKKVDVPQGNQESIWYRLPISLRRWLVFLQESSERNFGVFLGGQLIVSVIYAVLVSLVLSIFGFSYVVTTACLCGILMLIPFFGGPLSLLPPVIVGLGTRDANVWLPLIILLVLQGVLLNVVLPRIVSSSAGIGPVLTLFLLLAGAQVGGVWGVILSVPLAGVAKNALDYFLSDLKTKTIAPTIVVDAGQLEPGETVIIQDAPTIVFKDDEKPIPLAKPEPY